MKTIFQQTIVSLPFIVILISIALLMLSISWNRNYHFSLIVSILGLSTSLLSLNFIIKTGPINISKLIFIDNCSMFYTYLVLFTDVIIFSFVHYWLKNYKYNKEEFYLLIMISTLGCIVLINANHLVSLLLGIELISIPLFSLVSYDLDRNYALETGMKYMILSSVASSFLLFGIALLYAQSGKLSFLELKNIYRNVILNNPLLWMGIIFIIGSLGFKLSLVPFHSWSPDIYEGSPAPITIFLATVNKISIFGIIVRIFLYIKTTGIILIHEKINTIQIILSIISLSSIVFGSLMALNQKNIKRLLSYSSISHFGYLITGLVISQNNQFILEGINIYIIGYLFSNLGILGIISLFSTIHYNSSNINPDYLCFYRGLFWRHPILTISMTVMILSLAGIPLTLGFIGKFYIFSIIVQNYKFWWLLIAIITISSATNIYYYLRIIIILYIKNYDNFCEKIELGDWNYNLNSILLFIITFIIIIFGIYPQPIIYIVQHSINQSF